MWTKRTSWGPCVRASGEECRWCWRRRNPPPRSKGVCIDGPGSAVWRHQSDVLRCCALWLRLSDQLADHEWGSDMNRYILADDGRTPVPEPDLFAWSRQFDNREHYVVAQDHIGSTSGSTK